jgi:dUTP pyrophosphatase
LDYVEEPVRPSSSPTIIDFDNKYRKIAPMTRMRIYSRDVYELDGYTFTEPLKSEWYELHNGVYVFHTVEKVHCPQDISGFMLLRSSLCRGGITCTSALIDPGFYGHLTLTVNVPPSGLHIFRGGRFAQVVFYRLSSPAAGVYNGAYQEKKV